MVSIPVVKSVLGPGEGSERSLVSKFDMWLYGEKVQKDVSVLAEKLSWYPQRACVKNVSVLEDMSPLKVVETEGK